MSTTTAAHHDHAEMPPPTTQEVADGMYAYVQLDGSWGLNNAGILVGSHSVTLVDTAFTERRARALRDAVGELTDRPIRTLVNTHHHGDHTLGNFVVRPDCTIIAQEKARTEVIETGLSVTDLFPGVEWGEIEIAPPFVTFEERLNLYVDDVKVELIHLGPAAHTTNDVILWVPQHRLLYAGDLAFAGGTPFCVMGSVEGSLRAMEALRGLGAETIVPGHGPVCGPEVIDDMVAYLRFVQDTARRAEEAGVGPLEAARSTDLGRFADWLDAERIVGNLHRAVAERRGGALGEPLPLGPIVAEMIEYNGGQPLRCVA